MRGIPDLEIRHDGRLLASPYLLEVMLTARGRRDIPSSAFDQGRPLVFNLGAGIVKVLQIRCNPTTSPVPPVAHEGSTLRIGPELIGRRQTITIAVLVDGDRPSLVCTRSVLAQVTVLPGGPPRLLPWYEVATVAVVLTLVSAQAGQRAWEGAWTWAAVLAAVLAMAVAVAVIKDPGVRRRDPSG